jgi:hypothetical protein
MIEKVYFLCYLNHRVFDCVRDAQCRSNYVFLTQVSHGSHYECSPRLLVFVVKEFRARGISLFVAEGTWAKERRKARTFAAYSSDLVVGSSQAWFWNLGPSFSKFQSSYASFPRRDGNARDTGYSGRGKSKARSSQVRTIIDMP